jgi:concanavalin A-like lectin/glucanase superfamily protein/Ig-like domain-containing protein
VNFLPDGFNCRLQNESRGFTGLWLLFGFFLIAAPCLFAANCIPAPPGLVGWWPGDGNARDVIGTNHGILQGGATASVPAVCGSGFGLDGTNGFVQIPNAPELNPTNLSVECWVRFILMDTPGNSTTGAQYVVFKQNSRSTIFEGYNLSKHRYANDIFVWEVSSASGQAVQINGTTALQPGTWYHVVGVRGTNFVRLYVNGNLEAEGSVNFQQDYGNYPLYFGTSNESYWDHKLGGTLDEVALYNRALTSDEVAALYQAGPAGKCKAPIITTQPQGGVYCLGSSLNLTASASGLSPLTYQWQKDGLPVPTATLASLGFSSLQATNQGTYYVTITNSLGVATSSNAVIQLKWADWSISTVTTGSNKLVALKVNGATGQTYGLQSCDALSGENNWAGRTNLTLTSPMQIWSDPQPMVLSNRFYRLLPGPISIP